MMDGDVAYMGASELRAAYRARSLSPVEVVEALLDRIDTYDGAYRSHVRVCADTARAEARAAEDAFSRGGEPPPLTGVPVSHKDNLWTRGVHTGVHSRTSFACVPAESATAVARLHAAGAILLGKTNTTEFACGDQLEHGDTPNPWDAHLYSGASSAGSASAVAAGFVPLATGSDTGGSIRAPAALCGVVGVKATYGRVSRRGLVPLSWSMDHVGPMTRRVEDAALMLQAMAGHDPSDPTSARVAVPDFGAALRDDLDGVRVGVPLGHYREGLEPAVAAAFEASLEVLRSLGARVDDVALPSAGRLAPVAGILTMWEAFVLHAATLRSEGRRYGPKARAHIASGAFQSAADVGLAMQLRTRWAYELASAMSDVDVLVTPTLPFTALTRDAWVDAPPDTSWGTRAFNLSGRPAMTLPCGFDERGRPIGLQVTARAFDEHSMFRVAHAFEGATPWHRCRPTLVDVAPPLRADAMMPSVARGPVLDEVRVEAERQGLPLDDTDLARISGLVARAREGIATLRTGSTLDVEPGPTFVAT